MSDPVLDLLNSKGISFTVSGQDYLSKCLNPEHEDSNPSFRIDKTTGIAHCFSCGFKTNIFKHFGVLSNTVSLKVLKLKQKLKELVLDKDGVPIPEGAVPFNTTFRGISAKVLKQFEAFYVDGDPKFEDRLWFPIKDAANKVAVYIGRHTMSSGNPKYLIHPSKVQVPLYPCIQEPGTRSIVLVEGIFDMLNMYDKGCTNVVCTFGTNTLHTDTKSKLLPFMAQGITKIYIAYDGDTAGITAANKLKPLIEDAGYACEIIKLEDDIDPGDLDQEQVRMIMEYTK